MLPDASLCDPFGVSWRGRGTPDGDVRADTDQTDPKGIDGPNVIHHLHWLRLATTQIDDDECGGEETGEQPEIRKNVGHFSAGKFREFGFFRDVGWAAEVELVAVGVNKERVP